jgi:hypothetical protein
MFHCWVIFLLWEAILYGSIQQVRVGTKNEAILGTFFEVDFRLLVFVSRSYRRVHIIDCWHGNRGTKQVIQQYGFGTKIEEDLFGTILVCCKWIFPGWKL